MNNITKIIFENLEEFSKNFKGLNITHKHDEDCFRGCRIYNDLFSHLLQSQIKVIEAVIEEMKERNKFNLQELTEAQNDAYGQALEDQISSLNETLEFLKKSL